MDCRRIPSGLSGYGNMVVIARDFWRGRAEASAAGLPNIMRSGSTFGNFFLLPRAHNFSSFECENRLEVQPQEYDSFCEG